jgi:5-formyltetrahydrofolate cyclo-ligase
MDLDADTIAMLRVQGKALLRKRLRAVRKALPRSAALERSARICEALATHPRMAQATRVALFRAIDGRNEVELSALDEVLRARGVQVAYPSLPDRDELDPAGPPPEMVFRYAAHEALRERGWGFDEPPAHAPLASELDVVVVPGLAFDDRGHRVGYGAGFYDRALPRCRPAWAVGVAFDFQLVSEVPNEPHDVCVDAVVTDRR